MTEFDLLIDLHKNNNRQGPGSEKTTETVIKLIGNTVFENIADIGCGTGGQTLTLAKHLHGNITAVDIFPEFLGRLDKKAGELGLTHRIQTVRSPMEDLPFQEEEFDLVWSEGAIYIMGYENGLNYWKKFLKPGGYIAVSEIAWITDSRPEELEDYWQKHYAEIDTISQKIKQMETNGFSPIAHIVLPESDWTDNYYLPLQARHESFLQKHENNPDAQAIIEQEIEEFEFYKKYKSFYSYGFFIGQKL